MDRCEGSHVAVRQAVSALEGSGYLALPGPGAEVDVLYVGSDSDESERGWVYGRATLGGACGWLRCDCILPVKGATVVATREVVYPPDWGYLTLRAGQEATVMYAGREGDERGWLYCQALSHGAFGWFPLDAAKVSSMQANSPSMRSPHQTRLGPVPVELPKCEAWELALADLRRIDREAIVHGSRATGLAREDSDVDVVTTLKLPALLRRVSRENSCFTLVENVRWVRVPRLVLEHSPTGTQVDVISLSSNAYLRERDDAVRSFLQADVRVPEFAQLIGEWVRAHREQLPPRKGFPNTYTFRLTGFHYLMVRPAGALLAPWAGTGLDDGVLRPLPPKEVIDTRASARELFQEWLLRIASASSDSKDAEGEADERAGLWADVRRPWDTGRGWRVVDPGSGRNLTEFRGGGQATLIAAVAREAYDEIAATAPEHTTLCTNVRTDCQPSESVYEQTIWV
eukprot:gnl/TRDRNA2_/TRDRNA2_83685_c0_seq1.p1 gnl/TRDRNA2_/TRDRNA2_83685_c0~~gnl/TRDRNA2_/TRDRNA2_83685_c0_seq1.p1  ORF type:complete len:457 (+),score=74.88 gnl/TRDRNA2_/TRDRNA2_83685_c0_seq1:2-1372(+)